ncbi:MAG: hypothetical protein RMK50_06740 [Nitrososphaerota archaeon]|nr:hypothetical protein [Candidatus Bathyarchaeota archaeon]MDW8194497.1 hypothetical protein [Nitrososphaerota archaeon]
MVNSQKCGRDPEEIEPAHFMYAVVSKRHGNCKKDYNAAAKMLLLTRPRVLEKWALPRRHVISK